jgi:hypothetical protein
LERPFSFKNHRDLSLLGVGRTIFTTDNLSLTPTPACSTLLWFVYEVTLADRFKGRIAFIPDLGEDDIKQYIFDPDNHVLIPAGKVTELSKTAGACGPR